MKYNKFILGEILKVSINGKEVNGFMVGQKENLIYIEPLNGYDDIVSIPIDNVTSTGQFVEECNWCNGNGIIRVHMYDTGYNCPDCRGSGLIIK